MPHPNARYQYVRCSKFRDGCQARGSINELDRFTLNDDKIHTCSQTVAGIKVQLAKHRLKEAAKDQSRTLGQSYHLVMDAEDLEVQAQIPQPAATRFMKTSRDEHMAPDLRTLDKILEFLDRREDSLVKKCFRRIVTYIEPGKIQYVSVKNND